MNRPKLLDLPGGMVRLDEEDYIRLGGRSVYVGTNGYAYFSTNATGPITLHSFVMGGAVPGKHIDHINGDKLDDRKVNLRIVTPSLNGLNRVGLNKNNSSGIRGVSFCPQISALNPWKAQIMVNRRAIHLGMFATEAEAIAARRGAEKVAISGGDA